MRLFNIPFFPTRRTLENIEITYSKIQEPPKVQRVFQKLEPPPKKVSLPEIKKEEILETKKEAPKRPEVPRESVVIKDHNFIKKDFEGIEGIEDDISKKPVYIIYYRAVRRKIKSCADKKFLNKHNFPEGEVYLRFVVASNGELIELWVIDEKSTENLFLKKIAVESVREASPFDPFPKELDQSQITFNVIISFELK